MDLRSALVGRFFVPQACWPRPESSREAVRRPAWAIEPFVRQSPKFKFSLAAYSYRDLLAGDPPQLTLFDFVTDCARFGLEGTELTSYYFPADVDVRRICAN